MSGARNHRSEPRGFRFRNRSLWIVSPYSGSINECYVANVANLVTHLLRRASRNLEEPRGTSRTPIREWGTKEPWVANGVPNCWGPTSPHIQSPRFRMKQVSSSFDLPRRGSLAAFSVARVTRWTGRSRENWVKEGPGLNNSTRRTIGMRADLQPAKASRTCTNTSYN